VDGVAPPGDEDVDHRAAAPGDVGREDDDSEDPLDQLFGTDVNDDANANGQDGEEEDIPCPNDTDGDAVENEDDEADEQPNSSDYSFNKGGSALRTSFANEDIAGFEGHRFAFVFEGSGYTAGNGSVPGSVPGLSSVANGDLFDFRPRSLGASSGDVGAQLRQLRGRTHRREGEPHRGRLRAQRRRLRRRFARRSPEAGFLWGFRRCPERPSESDNLILYGSYSSVSSSPMAADGGRGERSLRAFSRPSLSRP